VANSLLRPKRANIGDDLVDVGIGEGLTERRHGPFLTVLDAVADKVVAARGVHQLRSLADGAAPVGVAEAADGGEQLVTSKVCWADAAG